MKTKDVAWEQLYREARTRWVETMADRDRLREALPIIRDRRCGYVSMEEPCEPECYVCPAYPVCAGAALHPAKPTETVHPQDQMIAVVTQEIVEEQQKRGDAVEAVADVARRIDALLALSSMSLGEANAFDAAKQELRAALVALKEAGKP